tara:strand:- start:587 stop:820 length:234 start_codon:yes stop_codon:yes gene_type:complete
MKDNKLIAEFMGLEYELQYHNSWDLLIPVAREVIVRYQIDEEIEIDYDELQSRVMDNDIERAYEEVVEFIKQYNDGK